LRTSKFLLPLPLSLSLLHCFELQTWGATMTFSHKASEGFRVSVVEKEF
jgi:hypothetical protein